MTDTLDKVVDLFDGVDRSENMNVVKMNIQIIYDGEYPSLCSGSLSAIICGEKYDFPAYCLSSGGYVSFDEDCREDVGYGPWEVMDHGKLLTGLKIFLKNLKGKLLLQLTKKYHMVAVGVAFN